MQKSCHFSVHEMLMKRKPLLSENWVVNRRLIFTEILITLKLFKFHDYILKKRAHNPSWSLSKEFGSLLLKMYNEITLMKGKQERLKVKGSWYRVKRCWIGVAEGSTEIPPSKCFPLGKVKIMISFMSICISVIQIEIKMGLILSRSKDDFCHPKNVCTPL